jgi:hypothetical protein
MGAPPLPLPPPIPGSLTDPSNFAMIPNLMDLFLLRNNSLQNSTIDSTNTSNTETTTANTSQSSPPIQRFAIFYFHFISSSFLLLLDLVYSMIPFPSIKLIMKNQQTTKLVRRRTVIVHHRLL